MGLNTALMAPGDLATCCTEWEEGTQYGTSLGHSGQFSGVPGHRPLASHPGRFPHCSYRGSAQLSSVAGPAGSPRSPPTPGPASGRTSECCDTGR